MRESKLIIRFGEVFRAELFIVRLAFAFDVSGAPTWVDEFPCAIIDFNGVPSVPGGVAGRNRSTCFVSETFEMLANALCGN